MSDCMYAFDCLVERSWNGDVWYLDGREASTSMILIEDVLEIGSFRDLADCASDFEASI